MSYKRKVHLRSQRPVWDLQTELTTDFWQAIQAAVWAGGGMLGGYSEVITEVTTLDLFHQMREKDPPESKKRKSHRELIGGKKIKEKGFS